uniref:G-protein coupled receptors family 1 profile domain-containing protein n=1 Tax=Setaria digitata TaxID=48799 RepID=A0A915PYZ4_9BILA
MELNLTVIDGASLDASGLNNAISRPATTKLGLTKSPDTIDIAQMAIIGALLTVLIMACIVGNLFVIIAIATERDLKSRPQYYLIFSLAVADLLVGLIVTPLGAWSTILHAWTFGAALCDFWISVDVLVCTSSILHLVAIALDRYWSITDVCYVQNRTVARVFTMLGIIWLLSLLISLAPMFGWKDSDFYRRVMEQNVCLISQQISYQIFSTVTAFYIPLCAIISIYYKIMLAAKQRFKRERERRTVTVYQQKNLYYQRKHDELQKSETEISVETTSADEKAPISPRPTTEKFSKRASEIRLDEHNLKEIQPMNGQDQQKKQSILTKTKRKGRFRENAEMKRERKAWRTLAIITGTFVACWTPFFLVSLYRPICRCQMPILLESITTWLGYLNSALNPIIYTVFSQDFRTAFKRILTRLLFLGRPVQR